MSVNVNVNREKLRNMHIIDRKIFNLTNMHIIDMTINPGILSMLMSVEHAHDPRHS